MQPLYVLALGLTALSVCGTCTAGPVLAGRHLDSGMTCESCHTGGQAGHQPDHEVCEGCHEPLDLALRTARADGGNPHMRQGVLACGQCHAGHGPDFAVAARRPGAVVAQRLTPQAPRKAP